MQWIFLLLIFTLTSTHYSAQSVRLKRKYYKTYQGEIRKYSALIGNEIVEISAGKTEVKLTKDSLMFQIGSMYYRGIFQVEKVENSSELLLLLLRENSDIPERFILNLKEKTLTRKGISPQPDSILKQVKKIKKKVNKS